jgi:hypothetical protein
MNKVLFVAKDGFTHGTYNFNKPGDSAVVPEHIALEWQQNNLGTVKAKPRMANKMLPDSLGNVDGSAARLSSVRPGPASTQTTSKPSGSGTLTLPKKGG